MKKLTLAVVALVLNSFFLSASKDPYKLGKVTKEELLLNSCPIDEEAEAYYIFDDGKAYINFDHHDNGKWIVMFKRKFKIKVLSKEGLSAANFTIPLRHYGNTAEQKILSVKGKTYNLENGDIEVSKLRSDNIHYVEVHKYLTHVKCAMPQVAAGSIIEVEYTIQSDMISNFYPWHFQRTIPVLHSKYDVILPEFMDYNTLTSGFVHVKKEQLDDYLQNFNIKYDDYSQPGLPAHRSFTLPSYSKYYIFTADNVAAFEEEPYISSEADNISKINFQLTSINHKNQIKRRFSETWADIDSLLLRDDDFGGFLNDTKDFAQIVESLNFQPTIPEELLPAIYYNLKEHLQWNDYYSIYTNTSPTKVWESGSGNSSEINLTLCGVLRASGIEASPIVSRTRSRGYFNRNFPSVSQLNHVMVKAVVNDQDFILDLTGNTPINLIPVNSINFHARVPGESFKKTWVSLIPKQKYESQSTMLIDLDPENQMASGKLRLKLKDYAALSLRSQTALSSNPLQKVEELWINEFPGTSIQNLAIENLDSLSNSILTNFDFTSTSAIEQVGDNYLVNLNMANQVGDNPFSGSDRKYPIDMAYGRQIKNNMTLNIPEGFEVVNLPASQKIALPEDKGHFYFMVSHVGNMVQVNTVYVMNQQIFASNEFEYLKQFYGILTEKLNEPLVLKKS